MTPEEEVAKFLSLPVRVIPRCKTCQLPNVDDVNRALIHIAKLKTKGKTTQTWKDVHAYFLAPTYNYPISLHSMRDHMRKCLKLS